MADLQPIGWIILGWVTAFLISNWLTNGALVACTWHCLSSGQLPDQVMWETMKALCV